jgi:hypothetical protein
VGCVQAGNIHPGIVKALDEFNRTVERRDGGHDLGESGHESLLDSESEKRHQRVAEKGVGPNLTEDIGDGPKVQGKDAD